jgi:hypothetical protein
LFLSSRGISIQGLFFSADSKMIRVTAVAFLEKIAKFTPSRVSDVPRGIAFPDSAARLFNVIT